MYLSSIGRFLKIKVNTVTSAIINKSQRICIGFINEKMTFVCVSNIPSSAYTGMIEKIQSTRIIANGKISFFANFHTLISRRNINAIVASCTKTVPKNKNPLNTPLRKVLGIKAGKKRISQIPVPSGDVKYGNISPNKHAKIIVTGRQK